MPLSNQILNDYIKDYKVFVETGTLDGTGVKLAKSVGYEHIHSIEHRQPVMKEDIDEIRGVDSSYFVRGLLDQKLIAISGRSELPGRPMLYTTTDEFLQVFGIKDLVQTRIIFRFLEILITHGNIRYNFIRQPSLQDLIRRDHLLQTLPTEIPSLLTSWDLNTSK